MEIEVKFRVDDPDLFASLAALSQLGPYELRPDDQVENQRNTYYDTADRRLQRARFGLRVRAIGARSIITLKGPNDVREGLHQRAEWEHAGHDPSPAAWPAGEARDQALALVGDAPLLPLLTIETRRRHIIASRDGAPVAELSMDQSQILAGGRRESLRELEIELLPAGARADLDALIAALRAHIPLAPENRSKLERGLLLLDRTES